MVKVGVQHPDDDQTTKKPTAILTVNNVFKFIRKSTQSHPSYHREKSYRMA